MIAIETWLCQILFCLFTFLVGGAPGAYVIAGTLHFRETSGIVTSKVKLRVKTHWGTPPTTPPLPSPPLTLSASHYLCLSLPRRVSLSHSLSTRVKEIRTGI